MVFFKKESEEQQVFKTLQQILANLSSVGVWTVSGFFSDFQVLQGCSNISNFDWYHHYLHVKLQIIHLQFIYIWYIYINRIWHEITHEVVDMP